MKYAVDTEFIEDGRTIDLISIAIVAEDGRELYLQNKNVDLQRASNFVWDNVIPYLWDTITGPGKHEVWLRDNITSTIPYNLIGKRILAFIGADKKPVFWTYYGDYDWVAVCQLFGTMMDLPKGWPMLAYDLRQLLDFRGYPDVTQPDDMPHHALSDARWIMETVREYQRRG